MAVSDPVPVIQATLAPMFLVSGASIFLNFTQARLFRVIDRLRQIGKEVEHAKPEIQADLTWQREHQLRRAVILRNAILFGIIVILLTVLTAILLLASDAIRGFDPGRWPLLTFASGMIAFVAALVLVTIDAFLSVAAARHLSREFGPKAQG